ncbi:MAG TPA: PDZ domain-containing protein, partial [Nevskiaceae bacterium]|nr:PDZ domain-containing protein [Nevskiaceae bacterium]
DQAGLKSGDLLTAANGQSLSAKSGDTPGPERKLLDVMAGLKPGDTVKLDYERDGRNASTTATATRAQDSMLARRIVIPDLGPLVDFEDDDDHDIIVPPMPPMPPQAPGAPAAPMPPLAHIHVWNDDSWDLAGIDTDLAPYFKTDAGVLVVKPARGSKLGLKGGDVVQKVNGEAVKSPDELRRKLHQNAGKEVALDIVRQGKTQSVKGTLPKHEVTRMIKKRIEINDGEDDPS